MTSAARCRFVGSTVRLRAQHTTIITTLVTLSGKDHDNKNYQTGDQCIGQVVEQGQPLRPPSSNDLLLWGLNDPHAVDACGWNKALRFLQFVMV
jgi:hypothetical protein